MGLFDRIKKVFTGEDKKEEPKQSPDQVSDEAESSSSEPEPTEESHGADIASTPAQADIQREEQEDSEQTDDLEASEDQDLDISEPTSEDDSQAESTVDQDDSQIDSESQSDADQVASQADPISQSETSQAKAQPQPETDQPVSQAEPGQDQDTSAESDEEEWDQKPDPEEVARQEARKYTEGLSKSRKSFTRKLNELFANFRYEDEEFFEELEDLLIESDVGFEATMFISEVMRHEAKVENIKSVKDAKRVLVRTMVDLYGETNPDYIEFNENPDGLTVILFVGVNGVGKTTTIAKMAHQYQEQGKKVMLAAGDTFRAGAIEQLHVWGDRIGAEVVSSHKGGDPAAVVYDGIEQAKAKGMDVLMIDTAGRLQNKKNLMNELEKMKRVISREIPDAPHETLLVLDATTGQNALTQAKIFKETTQVTGIVLTKMDGTAKGGIVLAIGKELGIPVKFVGLGETMNDLHAFDTEKFAIGLFKDLIEQTV